MTTLDQPVAHAPGVLGSLTRALTPLRVQGLAIVLGSAALAFMFYEYARWASLSIDGVRYFWLDDDQMISMRYARNLAEGHGLVWNAGERVEGYSNLLWVLVMAGVHAAGASDMDASLYMLGINLVLHMGLLVVSVRLLRVFVPDARAAALLLAAGLVFSTDLTYWSVNGFETTLLAFMQVAFLVAFFVRGEGWLTFACLALIPLVRSDAMHLFAGDAALLLWLSKDRRRSASLLLLAAAPLLLHFGWRRVYYGDWLPNTYYLKAEGLPDKLETGVLYVGRFLHEYGVGVALAAGAAAVLSRRDPRALAFFSTVLATMGYCALVGGDNFPQCRFFAHTLPVVWVFASAAGAALMTHPWGRAGLYIALGVTLVPMRPPHSINAPSPNGDPYDQVVVGVMLGQQALPGSSVAVIPAGMVPYFSRLEAHDMLGKTDAYIAHLAYVPHGQPAHGKYDTAYSFGRSPDFVVSCRPRRMVTAAPRTLTERQHPEADYVLSILASAPFRARYLPYRIESVFLGSRSQVYTHRESPEFERRIGWHDPVVAR